MGDMTGLDRSDAACILCRKHPDVGWFCFRHFDQFSDMLNPANRGTAHNVHRPDDPRVIASIPVLWADLDAQPARRAIDSPALGAFFKSTPPGDLRVMSLRDARSHTEGWGPDDDAHATLPVVTVLREIVARVDRTDIDGRLEARPASDVESLCGWLWARREWIAAQAWVADAWDAVRALHGQLRGACGDPPPRPLGPCIREVDENWCLTDGGGFTCGWPLFWPERPPKDPDAPLRFPALRCGACGWTYLEDELVLLVGNRLRAIAEQQEGAA